MLGEPAETVRLRAERLASAVGGEVEETVARDRRRRAAARRAPELRVRGGGGARGAAAARRAAGDRRRPRRQAAPGLPHGVGRRGRRARSRRPGRPRMSEPSPETQLWDLLRGALGTRALGIVAELGSQTRSPTARAAWPSSLEEAGADRGHAQPPAAGARQRRRLRRGSARRLPQHTCVGATAPAGLERLRDAVRRRLVPGGRPALDATGEAAVPARLRNRLLVVARRPPRRARGVRPRDAAGASGQRAEQLAALDWQRRRDRRRRRRRQRRTAHTRCSTSDLACAASSSTFRRRSATRRLSASASTFVEGASSRAVPDRRRLRPVDDPPRLGRRAGDCDPAHDSRRSAGGRPPARHSRRCSPEGNEPHGAKWLDLLMLVAVRRPRAQRGSMARAARRRRLRAGAPRGRPDRGAMSLTIGTAGHIDHGKTALVRALTGKDTDRLPEEQARGISIELGYAPLDLPDGRRLSLVDVPGHERFVRTMVAGATGIDLFLLAVDAGEGARPQTHEHLAVLRLLGIERGVIAITKADAVDAETLELALEEARELVPGAPVIATSAKTGQGLDELREALAEAAAHARPVHETGATRLFVDRVFTLHGIGTVATGTLWSGRIAAGAELRAEPGGLELRVRSVQVHDVPVETAEAGQRVAVSLPGVERSQLRRGHALVAPGAYPRQLPARRLARGARADRRRRSPPRPPRHRGDPRSGQAGRRAVRPATADGAGGGDPRRPGRAAGGDDGRRRTRDRSGAPAPCERGADRAARARRRRRDGARARTAGVAATRAGRRSRAGWSEQATGCSPRPGSPSTGRRSSERSTRRSARSGRPDALRAMGRRRARSCSGWSGAARSSIGPVPPARSATRSKPRPPSSKRASAWSR